VIARLHLPLIEPEDVVRHLGHQERHWKAGRSAHALTHMWAKENGLPRSIRSILQAHPTFRSAELIDGFLERQVDLGSAGRPSQTDLLAVIGLEKCIAIVAIEGKAGEPFGDLVSNWLNGSDTKSKRLDALYETLGLSAVQALPLRCQLLHRTASAVYEAKRYRTNLAVMSIILQQNNRDIWISVPSPRLWGRRNQKQASCVGRSPAMVSQSTLAGSMTRHRRMRRPSPI
jgi:hypothetical protein